MSALYLTDEQVDRVCDGLKQPAAKLRFLRDRLKLRVFTKPNGRPLVAVSEFERVVGPGALQQAAQPGSSYAAPNITAMAEFLAGRKKDGKKAQGR